ncbi:MAG TPA: LysM domain-containing protein [Acidimicrobiales bacterium]|nr:LysM domain-containing protein [Acidimicrobiales bacterium]
MRQEDAVEGRQGHTARRLLTAVGCAALVAVGCGGPKHVAKSTTLPPATTIPTTTTAPRNTYTVKAGDTLSGIAQHLGVALAAIIALNHLADANKLSAGQVLVVPPTTTTTTTTVATTTTTPTPGTGPATPTTAAPSTNLAVTPASGRAGTVFTLHVTGAKPTEAVTFEIDSPGGKKFTGPPHAAAADGTVSASYFSQQVDPVGTYNVVATGNQGTSGRASFRVDRPNPSP